MGFTEKQKQKVKEKAAFKCCRCHTVGPHIHHIIPKKDGGLDDIENAAPLCPNCHDFYGDNPSKRKEIKQMRDWWYGKVREMHPDKSKEYKLLKSIDSKLEKISKHISNQNQRWELEFDNLKGGLKELSGSLIEKLDFEKAQYIAPTIMETFSSIEVDYLESALPKSHVTCPNCQKVFDGYSDSFNKCPNCNMHFSSLGIRDYNNFKIQLSDLSNNIFDNLSFDNTPSLATGIIDASSRLEKPTLYITQPSDYIKCPECSNQFFGHKNSYNFCPSCKLYFLSSDDKNDIQD